MNDDMLLDELQRAQKMIEGLVVDLQRLGVTAKATVAIVVKLRQDVEPELPIVVESEGGK